MDVVTFESWSGNKYAVPQIVSNRNKSGGSSGGDGGNNNRDNYVELDDLDDEEEQKIPCADIANGKANPLMDMALAPPSADNIAGATFGYTRYGGTVEHDGIDFAGAIGTSVYSQFGGTITKVVSGQPNRVLINGTYAYPSGYRGDKNNAGNRIYVESNIGGNRVTNGYWHLQAGNPIAINPSTGVPWAVGDIISAGDLIGYIGITGNATEKVPHLHLNTKVNGNKADPAKYLNATVTTSSKTITTPCD
jgi:murein DD-endopeptidase MepM/ murein hydrolase activator NlpD